MSCKTLSSFCAGACRPSPLFVDTFLVRSSLLFFNPLRPSFLFLLGSIAHDVALHCIPSFSFLLRPFWLEWLFGYLGLGADPVMTTNMSPLFLAVCFSLSSSSERLPRHRTFD